MAKCIICNRIKGKRECLAFDGPVCSRCCGTSRIEVKCEGCSFYKSAQQVRRYNNTPHFTTHQMAEGNPELQDAANVIEGAICGFDLAHKQTTCDAFYENVMERLLDRYHFRDEGLSFSDGVEEDGYMYIVGAIDTDLTGVPHDVLSKLVGTVYRSIKRHSNGSSASREYIDFIYDHVGIRATTGVRVLPNRRTDLT